MDQLIAEGIDFKTVSKAFDDAADRKEKRDTAKITEARANVLQALRKYTMALYGTVDEEIMKEFEDTLITMEKMHRKPTSFKMQVEDGKIDDAKLEKFLKALGY